MAAISGGAAHDLLRMLQPSGALDPLCEGAALLPRFAAPDAADLLTGRCRINLTFRKAL